MERIENTLLSYPAELIDNLSSPCQKEYHRLYRVRVIVWNTQNFFKSFFFKFSNTIAAWTNTENLAIRTKCFELKISKKLLPVFLQYTFCFRQLIRCISQIFEWQTISQCSVFVSKCILLLQIIRLLTII